MKEINKLTKFKTTILININFILIMNKYYLLSLPITFLPVQTTIAIALLYPLYKVFKLWENAVKEDLNSHKIE